MLPFDPKPAVPVLLSGNPYERGLGQAIKAGVSDEQIRSAVLGRIDQASATGLLDADGLRYVEAQRAFLLAEDPDTMAELTGIADGLGRGHHYFTGGDLHGQNFVALGVVRAHGFGHFADIDAQRVYA